VRPPTPTLPHELIFTHISQAILCSTV
jgi:hypothetical protein